MKVAQILFAVALIVCVSGAPSAKDVVQGVAKKCVAQTKVSPAQTKIAFNQDIPKDNKEKCFLECVYTGVGVIKDGKFSVEGGNRLVELRFTDPKEKELAKKLIATCDKEIASNNGEVCSHGRTVRECFVKHGKQVNFFPSA